MNITDKFVQGEKDAQTVFEKMIAERVQNVWDEVKIGGFAGGGFVSPNTVRFDGSPDGVGTKIELLRRYERLETIGWDAVVMAAQDVFMGGIYPKAFYDYIVVDKLVPEYHIRIIDGVIKACLEAGCYLPGGETAEHRNVGLPGGYIDIAGFCVGFENFIGLEPKIDIEPGMKIWGWLSHGIGSNGYSKVIEILQHEFDFRLKDNPFIIPPRVTETLSMYDSAFAESFEDALLRPTAMHIKNIKPYLELEYFTGLAHITRGGMIRNVPRILPDDCAARIKAGLWEVPMIFKLIQNWGKMSDTEMYKTFNMGIQVVSVSYEDVDEIDHSECVYIGEVVEREDAAVIIS